MKEGDVPMATIKVCYANQDSTGTEQAAVLTNVAGT